MNVLDRLDETRAEHNVLEHPFYQRWSAGELSEAELGCYAREYRHAVVALARSSALAAREAGGGDAAQLRDHAAEEEAHVALWETFTLAAGAGEDGGQPLAETQELVRAWTAGEDLLEHLAVLYAIEAGQPEIARTKLAGLCDHYGYTEQEPAVEYFALHERLDREHARQARALIQGTIARARDGGEAAARMVSRAREALVANWRMLDAVEARFAAPESTAA